MNKALPGRRQWFLTCLLLITALTAIAQPNMTKTGGTSTVSTGGFNTTTRKFQLVYLPADLAGAASGNISKVFFEFASGGPITFSDFIVRLGQPATGTFPSSTNFHTGLTEVFNEPSFTIDPTGLSAGAWLEIPLENLFVYNATLPLVVEVTSTAASGTALNVRYSTGPSSPNHKKLYSTVSATATTGTTHTLWQNIGFTVTPIFPDDAGITAITSPVTPGNPGTNPVLVNLLNYGSNTLSTVQINWSVDGVLQTPYSWAGTLNQVASTVVNIGSFNFTAGNHTILAWTTLPNGNADGNTSNDQTSRTVLFCTPVTGTVQISSAFAVTDPALGQYKTFTDLASRLSTCGISGNVIVNVVTGTGPYVEQVTFNTVPGAGPSARITINGNGNVLEFSPNTVDRHILRFNAAQYFTLDNLTVRMGTTATHCYAIHLFNGSGNNTIQNCTVDMATNTGTNTAGSFYAAITATGSTTSVLEEDNIHNIIIRDNTMQGGTTMGYGITLLGNSITKATGIIIENNTIVNHKSRGIAMYYTDGGLIKRNNISGNGPSSGGLYIWFSHNNLTIDGNTISHSGNSDFEAMWLNTLTGNSIVKNNLIYNISNGNNDAYGIRLQAVSTGTKIYHNTIILDDQTSTAGNAFAVWEGSSSNTGYDFKNNIYYVTRAGSGSKAAYSLASLTNITTGLSSNYNVFYTAGANAVIRGTTVYSTLAAWNAGGAGPQDINSFDANPVFQPGTGIPTNLAINNVGLAGTGVTEDIVGTTRASTPDPGAYEFPAQGPLPVGFSYFKGAKNGKVNHITWGTATETDNKGFELQRGVDGKNYSTIAFIASAAANGNSNELLHYGYDDINYPAGTNYYRLKQVDIDGRFSYSGIVVLKDRDADEIRLLTIYPNPARSELGIILQSPATEMITVSITDIAGKTLSESRFRIEKGDNRLQLDTQALAAGTYMISFSCGNGCAGLVQKFVKQ